MLYNTSIFALLAVVAMASTAVALPQEQTPEKPAAQSSALNGAVGAVKTAKELRFGGANAYRNRAEGAAVDNRGRFYAVNYGTKDVEAGESVRTVGRIDFAAGKSELFYQDPKENA
ncbi:hypothetical protein THASP1DRAFT_33711, partial [Thamnocephalis sphaerospora]